MDAHLVERLTSGEGAALLASLPPYDEQVATTLGPRLREAGFSPDLVAAVLTQSELRAAAVDKFGPFAQDLLLTRDGLEQATRLAIAAGHAGRFRQAGITTVHDLGCGLGADALAMAGLDLTVEAVESDPVTAAMARHNLRRFPDVTVRCARAEEVPLPRGAAAESVGVWVDPHRRVTGVADITGRTRRVSGLEAISPSWQQVLRWAQDVPATGAKLAPSFPHNRVPAGAEAQWTSWDGDVVECAVWFGPLAHRPGRTAAVTRAGATPLLVTEADAEQAPPPARAGAQVGEWLYDPDKAIVRSGLVGALAVAVDGFELAAGVGYVTSATSRVVPYARRYAVRAVLPLDGKTLRIWLRDHGFGRVTLKKRGVSADPGRVRHQLGLSGHGPEATVVLTRVGTRSTAIVVDPRPGD